MGGGHYSLDIARSLRSSDREGGAFSYQAYTPGATSTPVGVHPLLNPFGKVREVNNETPIVVALDVTRSRGDDTKLIYDKLPELMGQIELHGYVQGAGISVCAVGDADADRAPLQVSQFEADNRIDQNLERIWIEEGGGGTGQESYELAAYFYARTNCVRLAKGTGKKGYFFFTGDEGFYPRLDKSHVRRIIGDDMQEDLPAVEIFRRLQEKFNTFLIYPRKSLEERKANIDAEVKARVTRAGGMYDNVDIRASLIWNNRNDLDLHVIPPSGEEVFYAHKQSACGGWLDVDMNVSGQTDKPVENVRWPKGKAPAGRYRVFVQNYNFHDKEHATPFRVELEVNGEISHVDGVISPNDELKFQSNVTVADFVFAPKPAEAPKPVEDVYARYSDDVVLSAWASVIPKEHILRIDDPKSIIEVLLGALAIANGARDLEGFIADLGTMGTDEGRIADVRQALAGLSKLEQLAPATIEGDIPAPPGPGGERRTTRL
ncbi:MAG: hypothetical protein IT385_24385 [Deltaproteobacteria bacterium]|nr:hypothetical protein [Deltaproteobacteria bacterium]